MSKELSINVDLSRANKNADDIDEVAKKMSTLLSKDYDDIMRLIAVNWNGNVAKDYLDKCTNLQDIINTTVTNLQKTASNIRSVAKTIYIAEMQNLKLIEEE